MSEQVARPPHEGAVMTQDTRNFVKPTPDQVVEFLDIHIEALKAQIIQAAEARSVALTLDRWPKEILLTRGGRGKISTWICMACKNRVHKGLDRGYGSTVDDAMAGAVLHWATDRHVESQRAYLECRNQADAVVAMLATVKWQENK